MCEADAFMRGFTRALARRNNAKQTGEPVEHKSGTGVVEHKLIKSINADEYKQLITAKAIEYIHKHKGAKHDEQS